MDKKNIISIEGNIGAGKTTFINIIKNYFNNVKIIEEPVEMWKNITDKNNKNILQKFYDDENRWAYTFQNLASISRIIKILDNIKDSDSDLIFLDRSLDTDANVFEKMLYESGKITEIEHKIYLIWYNFVYNYLQFNTDNIIIYLRCEPHKALERIKKRNREEEKTISIEYLTELHKYHEEWLINDTQKNVIVVDSNVDFLDDVEYQINLLNEIMTQIILIINKKNVICNNIFI